MAKTLIERLVPKVDKLRALHDRIGTRGYTVKLVAVRIHSRTDTGDDAGSREVILEKEITPTPRVRGNNQRLSLENVGLLEEGYLLVDEISYTLTFDELLGAEWEDDDDVEFFWELTIKVPTQSEPKRMRYRPKSEPQNNPAKLGWSVLLEAMQPERSPDGGFPDPYE